MKHLKTDASEILRSKLRRLIADENMDEALAYDLEAQIILNVRAGFLSIVEIAEEGMEYISQEYPEVKNHISAGALQELVKGYWDEYANTGGIRAAAGSYAEAFAMENKYSFSAI